MNQAPTTARYSRVAWLRLTKRQLFVVCLAIVLAVIFGNVLHGLFVDLYAFFTQLDLQAAEEWFQGSLFASTAHVFITSTIIAGVSTVIAKAKNILVAFLSNIALLILLFTTSLLVIQYNVEGADGVVLMFLFTILGVFAGYYSAKSWFNNCSGLVPLDRPNEFFGIHWYHYLWMIPIFGSLYISASAAVVGSLIKGLAALLFAIVHPWLIVSMDFGGLILFLPSQSFGLPALLYFGLLGLRQEISKSAERHAGLKRVGYVLLWGLILPIGLIYFLSFTTDSWAGSLIHDGWNGVTDWIFFILIGPVLGVIGWVGNAILAKFLNKKA